MWNLTVPNPFLSLNQPHKYPSHITSALSVIGSIQKTNPEQMTKKRHDGKSIRCRRNPAYRRIKD